MHEQGRLGENNILHQPGAILPQGHAVWTKKCSGYLPEAGESDVQQTDKAKHGSFCGRRVHQEQEGRFTSR